MENSMKFTGLAIALVLMVAGSFGNFIDRARLGYVVDFITLRSGIVGKTWALPTFNVADMIIVISLFCVLTMALSKKKTI
jgi:signal peptidase II